MTPKKSLKFISYFHSIGNVDIRTDTINKIETEHHEYGSSGNKDVEETEILTGSKISLLKHLNH